MFKNKDSCQLERDVQNQRINRLEDNAFKLFSNNITVQPRPSTFICSTRSDPVQPVLPPQMNLPIPYPRPETSQCNAPKMTFRNSQTKHDLSYCHVFNEPLRDEKLVTRPYADMIWNQMTNRRMTQPDCHGNDI